MPAAKRPITTMKHQIYQILKDEICNGTLPPGKWLQEKEIAEKLDVSRSPVREAIKTLVYEGLAIEYPNKGVFVKEFTTKDIEEIYEARLMLESFAIKNSVKTLTSKNISELMELLELLLKYYKDNDLTNYIKIDTELHEYIINLSGNSLIVDTYKRIYSHTQQFRIYSLTTQKRFDDSVIEHKTVIENIVSRNWKEADKINQIHLTLARDEIIAYFEAKKEADNSEIQSN